MTGRAASPASGPTFIIRTGFVSTTDVITGRSGRPTGLTRILQGLNWATGNLDFRLQWAG